VSPLIGLASAGSGAGRTGDTCGSGVGMLALATTIGGPGGAGGGTAAGMPIVWRAPDSGGGLVGARGSRGAACSASGGWLGGGAGGGTAAGIAVVRRAGGGTGGGGRLWVAGRVCTTSAGGLSVRYCSSLAVSSSISLAKVRLLQAARSLRE